MLRNWLADWKLVGRIFHPQTCATRRERLLSSKMPRQAEVLEDRTLLSVANYTAGTMTLDFTTDAGEADAVTISSPAANTIVIDVSAGDGGDGNDVVLVADQVGTTVYVNDDFGALTPGTVMADADPNTAGDQMAVFGVTAFGTIQDALAVIAGDPNSVIFITDDLTMDADPPASGNETTLNDGPGTYVGNILLDKDVRIVGTDGDPAAVLIDGGSTARVFEVMAGSTVTLDSITIQNGSTAGDGGGIFNAGSLTLNSSVVQNNTAASGGGIFNAAGGTLLVDGSEIRTNTASGIEITDGGGGISNEGVATVQNNSLILGNSAAINGGGILNISSATLTVENSTIGGNTASEGGGIYNNNGTAILQAGSIIRGNTATNAGGGVENAESGTLTVIGSTIDMNTAGNEGGGVRNLGTAAIGAGTLIAGNTSNLGGGIFNGSTATLTVDNATISGNSASRGGGILNFGTATIQAASQITGNAATTNGGGISNEDGTATIQGATQITANTAGEGGGLWNDTGTVTIDGVTIDGNTAGGGLLGMFGRGGGGIFNLDGTVQIGTTAAVSVTNNLAAGRFGLGGGISTIGGVLTIQGGSLISGNTAPSGGGISSEGRLEVLDGSMISNNTAMGIHGGTGGGILVGSDTATIEGSTISGNSAIAGGGLRISGGTATIQGGTIISGNSATAIGGGVANSHTGTVLIQGGTTISRNTSNRGGGVSNSGLLLTIRGSIISENTAHIEGGGIFNGGGVSNDGNLTATHSTISSNFSFGDGAGIYNTATLDLSNVTVSGNQGPGGVGGTGIINNGGAATIRNSTITNNLGGETGGLRNEAGTVLLVSTIIARNSFGALFAPPAPSPDVFGAIDPTSSFNLIGDGSSLSGIERGTNNNLIGTRDNPLDPRLGPLADNGGPTLTHALLPTSPAVNAGSNPLDLEFDQRGEGFPRQFGSQTDIGAFELQSEPVRNDILVTAPGPGTAGIVQVFDADTQDPLLNFEPYPDFMGGIRVAVGDVNFDGTPDIITAPGPGGGPHIKVISGTDGATELYSFFAYGSGFLGGMYVASADVNGDGFADIITGVDVGGGPHVRAFSGADGSLIFNFFAFDPRFLGGVRVAAGDISGDGTPDIIVGAGPGAGPHVRIFDGTTGDQIAGSLGSFHAYDPAFGGGVFVAAGDVDSDGQIDLITGAGAGAGPHVRVFDGETGSQLAGPLGSFFAYGQEFSGGVLVAASDINGDGRADLITVPGQGGGPHLRVFDAASVGTPVLIQNRFVEEPDFTGGLFVAGSVDLESTIAPSLADEDLDLIFADSDLLDDLLN